MIIFMAAMLHQIVVGKELTGDPEVGKISGFRYRLTSTCCEPMELIISK